MYGFLVALWGVLAWPAPALWRLPRQPAVLAAPTAPPRAAQVGISLNYDKVCMCLDFAPLDGGIEYASRYPGEWAK